MYRKEQNKNLWLNAVLCTLFSSVVAVLLYLVFVNISFFNAFEKAFTDFEFTDLYYSETMEEKPFVKDIVLVNTQKSDRKEIAQAIEKAALQNPKVIALDIIFKDLKEAESDSVLSATLQKYNHKIVGPFYFDSGSVIQNHPSFKTQNTGFINLYPEEGRSVVRNASAVNISSKDTLYSFAAEVSRKYDAAAVQNLKKLKDLFPIDYYGNSDSFFVFDIDELNTGRSFNVMKDAIVVFGYLGTPTGNEYDIEDKHFTPLNSEIAGKSNPDMYGAVIHANIINMLVHQKFLTRISGFWVYVLAFLVCVVVTYFGLKLYQKEYVYYDAIVKVYQFLVSVVLVYLSLLLLKFGVFLKISPVLILSLLSLELIATYKSMMLYFQKKFL